MSTSRFDQLVSRLVQSDNRRGAVRLLGLTVLGAGGFQRLGQNDVAAQRRKGKKKKGHSNHRGGGSTGPGKGLREICTPGTDTCGNGLQCSTPTTRHTCSSTVEGVENWCCVPPGGSCTECDCCGDYYCAFDDNNVPSCAPN